MRLEGIAKAGYYPTPSSVVERVGALIRPARHSPRQALRLLDPCCGTGAALRQLAHAIGGETYGIEIARDRADEAQAALDHLICGSSFAVRLAHGAFSCLWLNPPYDYDDESKRLEHAFPTTMTRALCPGGVLVFISAALAAPSAVFRRVLGWMFVIAGFGVAFIGYAPSIDVTF